jgi:acetyl-CoA C-acetyltransferase
MYIIDIKRTPFGKFLGSLSNLSATELTKPLFSYFLDKYPFLRKQADEVIMGNVLSAGIGMNPARIAAFRSGIGDSVPAYTINHVCASGMSAIIQGFRSIKLGEADLVLSGGMESMSNSPYLINGLRRGLKFGKNELIDDLERDGLYCSLSEKMMGETAEIVAKKYKIDRKSQDSFALTSHRKAIAAQKGKIFSGEIIEISGLKEDEGPRNDTSLVKMASLRPIFKPFKSVTAGNSSSINDGAGLALLASERSLKRYSLKPKAQILDSVFVGLKPELMGMGAKHAIEKLLERNSLTVRDIDLFEINEAFAAQVLAVMRELKIDKNKLNIYGGAIAVGHPLAASGVRIISSLINGLKRTKGKLGIASTCVGGGQGVAVLIKNL